MMKGLTGTKTPNDSVAIVGIGGVFPGAYDLDHFWNNVVNGVDAASEVAEGRWILGMDDAYCDEAGRADRVYSKRGCFISQLPSLAHDRYAIGADLLQSLDPSCHVLLAAGSQAFDDAVTTSLDLSRVSVVVGNLALPTDRSSALAREYLGRCLEEKVLSHSSPASAHGVHPLNRYVAGLPAGLLAKALGIEGGALALDAACSSSLYAVKIAVDELLSGRVDAVLAGGLSRPDCLYTQMGFSQLRALSPTGTCSPFDIKGDGLVVGEGSGMLMLKRTADAIRHGDRIYCVIKGIGLSNDVGGSLLAPSSEGQLRAMREAYATADWSPQDVDLIECHATGTPVGDAVEVASLRALWGAENWDGGQCVIGSVKSNVGHMLTAAGSVALIKMVLALREKYLPPTANFQESPRSFGLEDSPFEVLSKGKSWRTRDKHTPRRAAVSAFGFGGINAHVLLEEYRPGTQAVAPIEITPRETSPIAIVGMDACFGPWDSLRAFQERVLGGGADFEAQTPTDWWGAEEAAWFRKAGLGASPFKGYYLDEVAVPFDGFRIPPKELEEMLPQQLLMLHVAARALVDSGIDISADVEHSARTGVYIGLGLDLNTTNFSFRWSLVDRAKQWAERLGLQLSQEELDHWVESLRDASGPALSANRTMGALGSIVASRIAREFHFGGPSFSLSSEESSALRALEVAVRALQDGAIDQALVGGVDLAGDLRAVLATHRGRTYSSTGVCRPFDEKADGAVIGEGAGALVLKRVDDAVRDGNRVYALVGGIGVAGKGGVESEIPEESAYVEAARRAYREAKIDADSLGYFETHGSGCPEEDLMEARALARLLRGDAERRCIFSSAKADVGHTGAASGIAGVIKASLCVYQQMLPPLRNVNRVRRELSGSDHRLKAVQQPQYWLRNRAEGPLRAAVSSFSVDGTCCHVVLESHERDLHALVQTERLQPLGTRHEGLFVVEANNVQALTVGLGRLHAHVERVSDQLIETVARSWWRENREDPSKTLGVALVARTSRELLDQVEFVQHALTQDPDRPVGGKDGAALGPFARDRIFFSPEPLGVGGRIAFVYPGSGNQFLGMGRDLTTQWPEILWAQDRENEYLREQYQPDIFWNSDSIEAINQNHKATLFGQVTFGTAASDLIQSFGLRPNAVIGYSLGEMAGLFSLKAWTDRDLMLKRINESTLFTEDLAGEYKAARKAWQIPNNKTVEWALGVIDRPAKVARAALTDHKKVYTLIVNTLHECVVGGDVHAVEKLVKKLDCEFFPLHGVTTVHCEVAKEVQEPYRELHVLETTPPKDIRFYSGSWGTGYNVSSESAADSVLAQAIYGIDYPKVIQSAYDDGVRLFLEMGPGASCSRMIGEILSESPHLARSISSQGQDSVTSVLRMLGALIVERIPVDLSVLYGQETALIEHRPPEPERPMIRVLTGAKAFSVVLPERVERSAGLEAVYEPMPAVERPVVEPAKEPVEALVTANDAASSAYPLSQQWAATEAAKVDAHEAYLRFSEAATTALSEAVRFQISLVQAGSSGGSFDSVAGPLPEVPTLPAPPAPTYDGPADPPLALSREDCIEFAVGSIAASLGPEWSEIDANPTRVRLPDEPLMFVDRILSFHGEARSMTHGRVVTEHDILPGAWYLDAGRMPVCCAVEAGQADLILSAYLGVDFETKGLAVYRLLDAVITFHRGLPGPGETIHYDIRIERFFRQGDTYLFRFNFDATVRGQPLLTMRDGCAGYFTRQELDGGTGIVKTKLDLAPQPGKRPEDWTELAPMVVEAYSDEQVAALRRGDLEGCFGELFAGLGLQSPPRLPGGRMKLVDRVLELDPEGGRFGMGIIRAEMDIYPDDWFLTCHFIDDRVMPGTLMYECCLHTFRIFLTRMGWVGESDRFAYEPVEGVSGRLKCRGEVNETTEKVMYEITLKEIGYNPHPYAIADTLMYADGRPVVEMNDMAIQLAGLTRDDVEALWTRRASATPSTVTREARDSHAQRPALYDYDKILAYSSGSPSEAFGKPYTIFDEPAPGSTGPPRVIARLPRPPYQFLDRIVGIDAEQWKMSAGGAIEAEYDVPDTEWYFDSNGQATMPFSILLEVALQPCGWFAAYMGSALTSDVNLRFRNLGGSATQHRVITPGAGALATKVRCTNISSSGGMVIQNYAYEMRCAGELVYDGDTYFGFFSNEALAHQVGIRGAKLYEPSEAELTTRAAYDYPTEAPYPDDTMRMVDRIEAFDPKGGPKGLGFIRAVANVNPDAWFFKAHFYQDPVWPGSLGLEGFLQLLRHAAIERWAVGESPQVESMLLGHKHGWVYRGQVIPSDSRVTIEAYVTHIDDANQIIRADGFLSVDGRTIYQMQDFAARLYEE